MSFVRWLRKNNTKLMAVVVIVIMFGFVGGSYLSHLGQKSSPLYKPIAFYLGDQKITQNTINAAQNELEILSIVGADELLRAQDIEGIMLAELLFAAQQKNRDLVRFTRQIIAKQQYRIEPTQIAAIYERSMLPSFYWILLKSEAHRAGIKVSNQEAAQLLDRAIPVLFKGATYAQMLGTLVRRGTAEEEILNCYADILAVLQYCRFVCSNEDVTISEMELFASYQGETIDANIVKFDTAFFIDDMPEPDQDELNQQFEKYKTSVRGTVTDDNPYGFGYKLPDRVQLEYIAIKLSDVKSILQEPTQEETEIYYQTHKTRFTKKVPSDPNDPNSPKKDEAVSFAEVAQLIADELMDKKIYARADSIMQEVKLLSEINIFGEGLDPKELTSKQFEKLAANYEEVAQQVSQNHGLKVYTGKTGILTPEDMDKDKYLSTMVLPGLGYFPIRLDHVIFAIDELKLGELGPFDAEKSRMFENIGPAKDIFASTFSNLKETSRQICAIVRIVKAEKAEVPENMNVSFETHSLVFDPNTDKTDKDVYSVKKQVTEDIKRLKAMDTAKAKAKEFISLAKAESWNKALDKFNEQYPPKEDIAELANDPNGETFTMESITQLPRSTKARFMTLAAQNKGYPTVDLMLEQEHTRDLFARTLKKLVPDITNSIKDLSEPIEFKPSLSYFCVKDLSINRMWKEQFDRTKPMLARQLNQIQSQSLIVEHLNPQNIAKRMNFRWAENKEKPSDVNVPAANSSDANTMETGSAEAEETK